MTINAADGSVKTIIRSQVIRIGNTKIKEAKTI
jgi:hypothetical protein